MNETELDKYCEQHPHCDMLCAMCQGFIQYQRHELGLDERDDDCEDEYEDALDNVFDGEN